MTILETLVQLRDDLKTWVTNNLVALNSKVDKLNNFSGDYNDLTNKPNVLDDNSDSLNVVDQSGNVILTVNESGLATTNVDAKTMTLNGQSLANVVNEVSTLNDLVGNTAVSTQIENAINKKPHFSGDYNDLTNKPDILEDNSGNLTIADPSGNVILSVDENGLNTTALSVKGVNIQSTFSAIGHDHDDTYYTETEIDQKLSGKSDVGHVHDDTYYTESEIDAKLSPINTHVGNDNIHVTTDDKTRWDNINNILDDDTGSFNIADPSGNIVATIDAAGLQTTSVKTKELVVNNRNVLDAIDEHAQKTSGNPHNVTKSDVGLGNVENKSSATIRGELTNDDVVAALDYTPFNSASIDTAMSTTSTNPVQNKVVNAAVQQVSDVVSGHIGDKTIHITATERTQWTNKSDFSGDYNDLTNAPNIKEDDSNNLVIADPNGNIIFRSNSNGFETTQVITENLTVGGLDIKATVAEHDSDIDGLKTSVANKVDKVSGKGLSTNDYTTAEKNKLAGIASGAEVNVQSDWNATSGDALILNKPTLGSLAAKSTVSKSDLEASVQTSLGKADAAQPAVSGKGLSTNDYTTAEKNKLAGIAEGANKITVDSALSSSSTNPVQNKVVNTAINGCVPTSRTINGKALSSNISLTASDVGAAASSDLSSYVPTSRTVNGKALSSNISLTASDVGAAASSALSNYYTKSELDGKGFVSKTVLYTNSNYTAAFGQQKITISNLTNYDEICIEFYATVDETLVKASRIYTVDTAAVQWVSEVATFGSNTWNVFRRFKCLSNGIQFYPGYYSDLVSGTWGVENNQLFVPYRITGYKYN